VAGGSFLAGEVPPEPGCLRAGGGVAAGSVHRRVRLRRRCCVRP